MMKRFLAALVLLLMICGCDAAQTSAPFESAKVGVELTEVGKTDAAFKITVEWQGGSPSGYGWVLYDSLGAPVKDGESDSARFTVDGLDYGCSYYLSAWAQIGDDRRLCEQLLFETELRYDRAVAHGIDVSRWQEDIDWQAVAAADIDFCLLRIGYTGGFDARFDEYYSGAAQAGLDIGGYVYSYAVTEQQAIDDALDIINKLDGRRLTYPIYYDMEDDCQADLTREQMTAIADAFCRQIEQAGYKAGIYTTRYMLIDRFDEAYLAENYQLWVAQVADAPPESTNYQIVQYSHTGSVDGIKGDVDLNIAYTEYR